MKLSTQSNDAPAHGLLSCGQYLQLDIRVFCTSQRKNEIRMMVKVPGDEFRDTDNFRRKQLADLSKYWVK